MPLQDGDFRSIRTLVEKMLGQKGEYFITCKVIKRDVANNLVYTAEFGDQAIPLVALNYSVKYYDTDSLGAVTAKQAIVTPLLPKIGETIVVARELGSRRLPRLIGVLQGKNWISTEDE